MTGTRIAGRVIAAAAGFLAACAVASLAVSAVSAAYRSVAEHGMRGGDWSWRFAGDMFDLVAAYALLPSLIFMAYAERNGVRGKLAHLAVGAAIPLPVTLHVFAHVRMPAEALALGLLAPVAGALGGLAYWTVAGRHAGHCAGEAR